jgi:hypothetical protein
MSAVRCRVSIKFLIIIIFKPFLFGACSEYQAQLARVFAPYAAKDATYGRHLHGNARQVQRLLSVSVVVDPAHESLQIADFAAWFAGLGAPHQRFVVQSLVPLCSQSTLVYGSECLGRSAMADGLMDMLSALPAPLGQQILQFLSFDDLDLVLRVCRTWRRWVCGFFKSYNIHILY